VILEDVFSCIHVRFAGELDVFVEFRASPGQIRASHSDKVAETSHDATIAALKSGLGLES
jgi:hypothetical protein